MPPPPELAAALTRPAPPSLSTFDPAIAEAIEAEEDRQEQHLELIASENYASANVLAAQGCVMTNKYAEGYPRKRYYGGCECVDRVEELAISRAQQLFGADYVNVQPHSGSQANAAAYAALLTPGDTILGMSLAEGGHLTHGAAPSFSGKLYRAVHYGVDRHSGRVDYDAIQALAEQHRPKMIVSGFSAYSRKLDWQRFRAIADGVGAYLLADIAHVAGLVATGLYPDPLPHAHVVTSTTHKTLRGPRGGIIMSNAGGDFGKKLNSAVFPGGQGGPLMHVIAAKAVSFLEALDPSFVEYQRRVIDNASRFAQHVASRGYAVVSGGTDIHMFLLDLRQRGMTGKHAEALLESAHIVTNKNAVPDDPQKPFVTSGLRIGSPAVTTRGFGVDEITQVAEWVCEVLDADEDPAVLARVRDAVRALCERFPVYR